MRRFVAQARPALAVLVCAVAILPGVRSVSADAREMLSGGLVGEVVDEQDHRLAVQAARRALDTVPNGTGVAWNNPINGHTGSVAPTRTYEALGGGYCRQYESTVTIEGRLERTNAVACRLSDGSWRLLTNQ